MVKPNSPISLACWRRSGGIASVSSIVVSAGTTRVRTKVRTESRTALNSLSRIGRSRPFEDGGHSLTAADAHRLQAVARPAALHLVQQGGQDPHTRGPDRVAEGYSRTVDVDALPVG